MKCMNEKDKTENKNNENTVLPADIEVKNKQTNNKRKQYKSNYTNYIVILEQQKVFFGFFFLI